MTPDDETGPASGAKKPPETTEETTHETDSETPVSETGKSAVAQEETVDSEVRETRIVSAKGEDVSKWRKYAVTYYRRSLHSAAPETRQRNRQEYEHWRDLLTAVGYELKEGKESLSIIEPAKP